MDVTCIGELLIDFLAVQSGVRFEDVREFRRVPGGATANVAAAASKLGMASAFIGRVGDDRFGRYLSSVLVENGVDISQMQYDSKARTTLAFISLPTPNTRQFLFYRNPGADMNLDYKKFNKDFIKDTAIFHFGSITLITEPGRTSTYQAVKMARRAGAIISYDPNLREMLWPSPEDAKKEITMAIPLADIIKVSHEELEFISGTDELEKGSEIILDKGPGICLVTMGEKGCYFNTGSFSGKIGAYSVDAVDATGCGDSFVSGVLSGIAASGFHKLIKSEEELLKTLEFASAAAAITATKKGVIPALPLREEVEGFLERENIKRAF
jgi:fructokinase